MGLMYVFPATEEETNRVEKSDDNSITLKSYGLPLVFWGYLVAIFAVIFIMFIAIKDPLKKILSSSDDINKIIALAVIGLLVIIPIILLCFYFYEKRITKKEKSSKNSTLFFRYQIKN